MKIGIIGFGNIGKMIAHKLEPVYGRINISYFDIKKIRTQYHKAKTITELVDWSDLIFICVKPQILPAVFLEAKHQDKIFLQLATRPPFPITRPISSRATCNSRFSFPPERY